MGAKRRNLIGQPFGALTVEALVPAEDNRGVRAWLCRCTCERTVIHTTSRLTSGSAEACPACGGPQPRKTVYRTCLVCGQTFEGTPNAAICSRTCRAARRRGLEAGVDSLPVPTKVCGECGREYQPNRSQAVCSEECRQARQRRKWREYWERHPEKTQQAIEARKARRKTDPEWAKRLDQRKYRRTKSDPKRLAKVREKARQLYRKHAAEIHRRRKEKQATEKLTAEELAARIARGRESARKYRRKRRLDPATAESDRTAQREFKRQQKSRDLQREAGVLLAETRSRLTGETSQPARTCSECGAYLIGKHPTALVCSAACRRARTNKLLYPPRARPCLECGRAITAKTARLLCSEACQKARKSRQTREARQR